MEKKKNCGLKHPIYCLLSHISTMLSYTVIHVYRYFTETVSSHLTVREWVLREPVRVCVCVSVHLSRLDSHFAINRNKVNIIATLSQSQPYNYRSEFRGEPNVSILIWTSAAQNKKIYMQKNANNKLSIFLIFYMQTQAQSGGMRACVRACVYRYAKRTHTMP